MSIGFVGTGTMGKPMAANCLKAGHSLRVYARHPQKIADLVDQGAAVVSRPSDLDGCTHVVLSLPFDPEVEEVLCGHHGILTSAAADMIIIDTTTGTPSAARKMAGLAHRRSVTYIDAPVSGGIAGAHEGRLSFLVGGADGVAELVEPVLRLMGKKIFHTGPAGTGRTIKALNQIVSALNTLTLCETAVLGSKLGVTPTTLYEILRDCAADSYHLRTKFPDFIIPGEFNKGHRIEMMIKDLDIALAIAKEERMSMVMTGLATQLYRAGASAGYAAQDISAMSNFLGGFAGITFSGVDRTEDKE